MFLLFTFFFWFLFGLYAGCHININIVRYATLSKIPTLHDTKEIRTLNYVFATALLVHVCAFCTVGKIVRAISRQLLQLYLFVRLTKVSRD